MLVAVLGCCALTGGAEPAYGDPPPAAGGTGYDWPMPGPPPVVRRFDPPPKPWLPGHRGVDLGGTPGEVVRSAGAGVVLFAGTVAGVGVVSVGHAGGLRTTYEPILPTARAGQRVRTGDPIGLLLAGHPGCPVVACLHWGLLRGRVYLDPLSLLGLGRVRLLPMGTAGPAAAAARPRLGGAGAAAAVSGPWVGLAVGGSQPVHRDVGVDLRAAQRGVAEQFLDGAQVGAAVQEVGGGRVA